MIDKEKVIKAFRTRIISDSEEWDTVEIPVDEAVQILELLKEQDPVKPHYNARTNWYECGACHYSMTSGMHCKGELIPAYKANYCAKCGKGVMWE